MDRKKKFIKYIFLVSSLFAVFLIIIYALFLLEDSIAVLSEKVAFFLFIGWAVSFALFIILALLIGKYEESLAQRERMISETLDLCSSFVDAKDPYTSGHSKRVAAYSKLIAKKLGFSDEWCRQVYYAAMLHDIGKCYVPDEILKKPSKLTDEEYDIIKKHPLKGMDMVKNLSSLPAVKGSVLYHHERYDGKGYPNGTAGEDIPIVGRIISVVDAYDAMHSSRVYREKMENDEIVKELIANKGTQFDPKIVDAFLEVLDDMEKNKKQNS